MSLSVIKSIGLLVNFLLPQGIATSQDSCILHVYRRLITWRGILEISSHTCILTTTTKAPNQSTNPSLAIGRTMFTQQQESKEKTQTSEQIDSVQIEGLVSCLCGFCELSRKIDYPRLSDSQLFEMSFFHLIGFI